MAKTPKSVVALMANQQALMDHITEVLRVKRETPIEYQASHVRDKSEEYYIGLADGTNSMLENALHQHKCYAGFFYMGVTKKNWDGSSHCQSTGPGKSDYAEWRRMYYTNGLA